MLTYILESCNQTVQRHRCSPNPSVPETLGREIQPQHQTVWTGSHSNLCFCVSHVRHASAFICACVLCCSMCGRICADLFRCLKEHFTDFRPRLFVCEYTYRCHDTFVNNLYLVGRFFSSLPSPKADDASTGQAAAKQTYFSTRLMGQTFFFYSC